MPLMRDSIEVVGFMMNDMGLFSGRNLNSHEHVRVWLAEMEAKKSTFTFPDFAHAYTQLFASEDPNIRLNESQAHFNKQIKLLRSETTGKVTHVSLRKASERGIDTALHGPTPAAVDPAPDREESKDDIPDEPMYVSMPMSIRFLTL